MTKRAFDASTSILLGMSVLLNIGLAYRVKNLTKQKLASQITTVSTGNRISSMEVTDSQGRVRRVDFVGAEPKVLYVFSPTCGWCAKNLVNIKKLYDLRHSSFVFIGLSLNGTNLQQYIASSGFPLESFHSPSAEAMDMLHMDSTPETIVIDSSGVVRKVWVGAYRDADCRDIEKYFEVPEGTLSGVM